MKIWMFGEVLRLCIIDGGVISLFRVSLVKVLSSWLVCVRILSRLLIKQLIKAPSADLMAVFHLIWNDRLSF